MWEAQQEEPCLKPEMHGLQGPSFLVSILNFGGVCRSFFVLMSDWISDVPLEDRI